MRTITPEKLQVLLEVAQRAPASLAERIICQEVAGELVGLVAGAVASAVAPKDGPDRGTVPDGPAA